MVGPGRFLGRVVFHFALAPVLGGQPVSSSVCIFWTVTFLPLLNGDWLHIRRKCHVIDGGTRLGKKEPKTSIPCKGTLTVGKSCVGT